MNPATTLDHMQPRLAWPWTGVGLAFLIAGCGAPPSTPGTVSSALQHPSTNRGSAPPTVFPAGSGSSGGWWSPAKGTSWQIQFTDALDTSVDADVFDIDGADQTAEAVSTLHARGAKVICYFNAGSWEDWRSDADGFPSSVKGKALEGWPGEKWLDIRQMDLLLPIMEKRIADCKAKGFDAVDPDNLDGYTQDSGFSIGASDQIAYNTALAELAHRHGLGIGLKNEAEQVAELVDSFDFAVVEECIKYNECDMYAPFTANGKAVLHIEYEGSMEEICAAQRAFGFSTLKKNLNLDAWRSTCP
jgi:hypothetical protein